MIYHRKKALWTPPYRWEVAVGGFLVVAWVYLEETNQPLAIYYRPVGQKERSNFIRKKKENF